MAIIHYNTVGIVQLNGNPSNYFAEVEQAAFEPSNRVPGIGFSPDKVLQNRVLSYSDAHRYRLGVNYDQIPVNQAKHAKVRTYHRDGFMRVDGNGGNTVNYEPNTFDGPMEDPAFDEPPLKINGDAARYNSYPVTRRITTDNPGDFMKIHWMITGAIRS